MPIEVLMPALSPTMTEGNLARWLKQVGDEVKSGDIIAEIETDKATMEVEAVDDGKLAKILVEEGAANVPVNQLIALILEDGEDDSEVENYTPANSNAPAAVAAESNSPVAAANSNSQAQNHQTAAQVSDTRVKASPLARKIAAQQNVPLNSVQGTGPYGRIIKADVVDYTERGATMAAPVTQSSNIAGAAAELPPLPDFNVGRNPIESDAIPHTTMRKVIAERLLESKQTVPHFYLSIDCCIDNLMQARAMLNEGDGKNKPTYKISVNDIVIKASAMALREVPAANSSWHEEVVMQYKNVDVSVAVAIDGGLITPIVKNADQKSLSQISIEMKHLIRKAKEGKLAPHEFQGGGFSISNLGMFGIKNFQAIINPPQSCILAVGTSEKRPVFDESGNVKPATMMSVSLSADHRVVDGAVGAKFLAAFKRYIESPVLMLA